jgi:hypothetical protein
LAKQTQVDDLLGDGEVDISETLQSGEFDGEYDTTSTSLEYCNEVT